MAVVGTSAGIGIVIGIVVGIVGSISAVGVRLLEDDLDNLDPSFSVLAASFDKTRSRSSNSDIMVSRNNSMDWGTSSVFEIVGVGAITVDVEFMDVSSSSISIVGIRRWLPEERLPSFDVDVNDLV